MDTVETVLWTAITIGMLLLFSACGAPGVEPAPDPSTQGQEGQGSSDVQITIPGALWAGRDAAECKLKHNPEAIVKCYASREYPICETCEEVRAELATCEGALL